MLIFLMIMLGMVTFLMGVAILLQEPKQGGLGGSFGMGGDHMLGTSTSSGISRFTTMLAVIFFALSITVGVMSTKTSSTSEIRSAVGDQSGIIPTIGSVNPILGVTEVPLPEPGTGTDEATGGTAVDAADGREGGTTAAEDDTGDPVVGETANDDSASDEVDGGDGSSEEGNAGEDGDAVDGESSGN